MESKNVEKTDEKRILCKSSLNVFNYKQHLTICKQSMSYLGLRNMDDSEL